MAGTTLTASWEPPLPAQSSGVISSYTLLCFSGETLDLRLNPISTIQLYDLSPNTQYMCRIAAWTAVGQGPFSSAITVTTEGMHIMIPLRQSEMSIFFIFLGSDINFTVLRWIPMGANYDSSQQQFLPATDDGFEGPIAISIGFPFGSSVQEQVFVSTLDIPEKQLLKCMYDDLVCRLGQMDSFLLRLGTTVSLTSPSLEMLLSNHATLWPLSGMT